MSKNAKISPSNASPLIPIPKHGKFQDLTGLPFGRWVVVGYLGKFGANQFWRCRCKCGAICAVYRGSLKNGSSISCGCYRADEMKQKIVHGMCAQRGKLRPYAYRAWQYIRRISRKLSLKVADEWRDDAVEFCRHFGDQPTPYLVIGRIDKTGDFVPSNMRWMRRQMNDACISKNKNLANRNLSIRK